MDSCLLDGSGDWKKKGSQNSHRCKSKHSRNVTANDVQGMVRRRRKKEKSLIHHIDIRDAETVSQVTAETVFNKRQPTRKRSKGNMPFQLLRLFTKNLETAENKSKEADELYKEICQIRPRFFFEKFRLSF